MLTLPPELVLEVLSYLSLPSLSSFRQVNHEAAALVLASAEPLYRRLAFEHGYCASASSSATGLVLEKLSPRLVYDEGELARVVASQRAMGGTYDGCRSWEDFARRRFTLDRNWREGAAAREWRKLSPVDWQGVWRFKLDPEACEGAGAIVTSGTQGGYQAFHAQTGERLWSSEHPDVPYPHVELSMGYLVMSDPNSNNYIIWRRDDMTTPPATIDAATADRLVRGCAQPSPGLAYLPFCRLVSPGECHATKFRFPLLAGVSTAFQDVYLWDVRTSHLVATIDIASLFDRHSEAYDPHVNYVELDDQVVFIAGRLSVTIWSHEGGILGAIPPAGPPEGFFRHPSLSAPRWSAIHHGTRGDQFVATSLSGCLIWTPRQRNVVRIGSREALVDGTVVLQMEDAIVQLSVENGRAAFVTKSSSNRCGLWMINLRDFSDLEDFHKDAPVPICLSFPLPTLLVPSRLEMTTDAIFVGAQSSFGPAGALDAPFAALDGARPQQYQWHSLTGHALAELRKNEVGNDQGPRQSWEQLVRMAQSVVPAGGPWVDSFLVFNFGAVGADE